MTTGSFAVLGSKSLCEEALRRLQAENLRPVVVVSPEDRGESRSRQEQIKSLCRSIEVPFTIAANTAAAHAVLAKAAPDLLLVLGWYRMIPAEVLDSFPAGVFGIHYSQLPAYRGSAPVVWAMLNGEASVGYSIFKIEEGMDTGDLAATGSLEVGGRAVGDVISDLDRQSVEALAGVVPRLLDGSALLTAQSGTPSYGGPRNPQDCEIDWSKPAPDLALWVRAQSAPYPGAFSRLGEDVVRIWDARPEEEAAYDGAPGQVLRLVDGDPVVAAGDRTGLRLTAYTWEGSDSRAFPRIGQRLSPSGSRGGA